MLSCCNFGAKFLGAGRYSVVDLHFIGDHTAGSSDLFSFRCLVCDVLLWQAPESALYLSQYLEYLRRKDPYFSCTAWKTTILL